MPPTTVSVGPTPWAQAATEDKILGRVQDPRTPKDTPKDVNITVSKSLWLGVSGLPDITKGKILQWQKRSPTCLLARMHARTHARMHAYETPCTRCSPTGSSETAPRGEALNLRGAARVHAQAARLRRGPSSPTRTTCTTSAAELAASSSKRRRSSRRRRQGHVSPCHLPPPPPRMPPPTLPPSCASRREEVDTAGRGAEAGLGLEVGRGKRMGHA